MIMKRPLALVGFSYLLGQAAAVILTIILVVLTQIVTRSLRRLEVEQ